MEEQRHTVMVMRQVQVDRERGERSACAEVPEVISTMPSYASGYEFAVVMYAVGPLQFVAERQHCQQQQRCQQQEQ